MEPLLRSEDEAHVPRDLEALPLPPRCRCRLRWGAAAAQGKALPLPPCRLRRSRRHRHRHRPRLQRGWCHGRRSRRRRCCAGQPAVLMPPPVALLVIMLRSGRPASAGAHAGPWSRCRCRRPGLDVLVELRGRRGAVQAPSSSFMAQEATPAGPCGGQRLPRRGRLGWGCGPRGPGRL